MDDCEHMKERFHQDDRDSMSPDMTNALSQTQDVLVHSMAFPRDTSSGTDADDSHDIEVDVDIDNNGCIEIDFDTDEAMSSHERGEMAETVVADTITETAVSVGASNVQDAIAAEESGTGNMGEECAVRSSLNDEDEDMPIEIEVCTKDAGEIQNVAELCKSLSACQLGTTLSLSGRQICRAPESSNSKDSRWLEKPLWPQLSEINETNIQTGLFTLAPVNAPDARLCCVSGMGWELEGGTVELGNNGVIVFDSTCDNGVVNGVIFRGCVWCNHQSCTWSCSEYVTTSENGVTDCAEGLIACYGRGCVVTLVNVEFDRCSVVALKGAHVKLEGCRFPLSVTKAEGIAVFAHGNETLVTMSRCSIVGGVQGVACHGGARLEASDLTVKRTQVSGIEVKDKLSRLELRESVFEDFSDEFTDKLSVVGALVHCQSKALVRNMTVKNVAFGVAVLSAGHADIVDSHVTETQWNCISFGAGSTGSVTSSMMSRSHKASGLHVSGNGTRVDAKDCKFRLNRNAGVFVLNQAVVNLEGCETGTNKVAGYKVKNEAALSLLRCSSDGDRMGCHISDKGQLSGREAVLKESVGNGMSITTAGSASLLECYISESSQCGADVRGVDSVATMVDCMITGAQTACVVFMEGSRGQLTGCTLKDAQEMHGILCDGKGTGVEMKDCKMIQNGISGVIATYGAVMKLSKCATAENQSSGYCVQKKGEIEVVECSSTGDKQGFKVYKGGRLKALRAEITDSVERGAYVSEGGFGDFRETMIMQSGTVGVEVKYSKSHLIMADGVISNAGSACVAATQGGKAQLEGCSMTRACTVGVEVSGNGTDLHAQDCQLFSNQQGGATCHDYGCATLTACHSKSNGLGGYMVSDNGVMNLTACTSKSDKVGCSSSRDGWLSGKDVTVEDTYGHGIRVWGAGAGDLSGCKVINCRSQGIEVKDLNSKLYMKDSSVTETKLGCILVSKGAQGTFHGCEVSLAKAGHGIEANGKGTVAEVSTSTLTDNTKAGAYVADRASMTLMECVTSGHNVSGYEVQGRGAILRLNKSISKGDRIGCLVSKEGKVSATESTLQRNLICGLSVAKAGKADLHECMVEECGANGVEVTNIRSLLSMTDCSVSSPGRACVLLSGMAKGELHGCVLTKAQKLHGTEVTGDGTEITMTGCRFEHNRQVGAFAGDLSQMYLSACESTGNKIAGYEARGGATMTLEECTSDRFVQKGSLKRSAKVETLKNARR